MRNILLLALLALPLAAQRDTGWDSSLVRQTRIDLRDLGYPPIDVIPNGESEIHSLAVAPNGVVWGATSGKRSHLLTLDPQHGYVQPLGVLPGVTKVTNGVVVSPKGDVYIGAGLPNGHLFRYKPGKDYDKPIQIGKPLEVEDLGAPVPGEGIYALAINNGGVIWGVTWPNGTVFSYTQATKQFRAFGKVAEHPIPGERFEHDKSIGRAIGIDANGTPWFSGENGVLFAIYDGLAKVATLPGIPGREPYVTVDAWAQRAGALYGATSDGYLFRMRGDRPENLGKPLLQSRIRGLAFAKDGKLYGVGGADDEMARLFSYNPSDGTFEILGMVDVNRRPYYTWQAYVIGAIASGPDGTLYLGQAERKSKLYLFYP